MASLIDRVLTPMARVPWLWLVMAGAAGALALTLKPGLEWDGDGALYVLNALNILHGQAYAATDYLVNPANASYPAAYPPGLPLLLALVLKCAGMNFLAMKAVLVACYIALLAVMARIGKPLLGDGWGIVLVAALAFNPYVFFIKDMVFSEFPFMLLGYCGLLAFDRLDLAARDGAARDGAVRDGAGRGARWRWMLASGLAIGAACEVRAIGMVMLAAVAVISLWRFRRLRHFGPAVLGLALAESTAISRLFPPDLGTYAGYFRSVDGILGLAGGMMDAASDYYDGLRLLLIGYVDDWTRLQTVIACGVLALSALGVGLAARRRLTVYEVFAAGYAAALLLYPIHEESARYALPLLPMIVLYFLVAVRRLDWPPRSGLARAAIVSAALAVLYVPHFTMEPTDQEVSADSAEATELFQQIRQRVPADGVILCSRPTVIALLGPRRSTNPPLDPTPQEFSRYADQTGARWMVELLPPFADEMAPAMPALRDRLEPVFANRAFVLYRLRGNMAASG